VSDRLLRSLAWLPLTLSLGCSGAEPAKTSISDAALAPAVRRLSAAELDAAAALVLGQPVQLSAKLPPDTRQFDFSRNVAQTVDPLTLRTLYDATRDASATIDLRGPPFPGCAASAAASDQACAASTVAALARQAFRRTPTSAELAQLSSLFAQGADGTDFKSGAALVVRALLASPKFLYTTALGAPAVAASDTPAVASPVASQRAGRLSLSDDELASELSLLISGQAPDDELVAAAARGDLRLAENREAQAVRLLQKPEARFLYERFVSEWFGIVRLDGLAKSSSVIADFSTLRQAMFDETNAFVDDVMTEQGGSLAALLAGGYSIVPPALAGLYGIEPTKPGARVSLVQLGRVGILQQGAFLSTFAHEAESAPVLRGKAVLERLLCASLPKPTNLKVDIVPPAPDPNATTRERYARHATDPVCKGCHEYLDGVGFTFENFDAIGRLRTSESSQAIDTSGDIALTGNTLTLDNSLDLARALATSEEVRACAARQVVRFAAGQSALPVEFAFADSVSKLSLERRASILGLFLEYVKSDWFAKRKSP
jgi:Protein of unknown function (DUF1588)/Protein of unknown function (DUF1592)/Protein of unknown function (DUF1595)